MTKIISAGRQLLFLVTIAVVISSCWQSNEIYINFDKQLICSANSEGIYRLYIKGDSDSYILIWNDSDKNAPTQLGICPLTNGYVNEGFTDSIIHLKCIRLQKNKLYRIERAQGDASPFSIKVLTDENGKFSKVVADTLRK